MKFPALIASAKPLDRGLAQIVAVLGGRCGKSKVIEVTDLLRAWVLAVACGLLPAGCVHAPSVAIGRGSFSQSVQVPAEPPSVQSARMVAAIRRDVRKVAETAGTAWLEQALAAVGALPREEFVSTEGRSLAYLDLPQNIGFGQTIFDPYIVAIMTGALQLPQGADVLNVGTGSGYQAAVLAKVARHVLSIEIVPELAGSSARRLSRLGFRNVEVRSSDGFAGWPEHAPFDGIVVAAGAAEVPRPLIDQLAPGGRLVMPVGPTAGSEQLLVVSKRRDGSLDRCSLGPAMFVPLTGSGDALPARFGQVYPAIRLCHGAPIN